jgi:hydrogenase nickel incorporation protein HypA/HybF
MHELSIANDLVTAALDTAKQNNAKKVISVTVELGELAMVNPEQLSFLYEVLTEENMLKGSKLVMETKPASGECSNCGYKGPITDRYTCACPKCSMTLNTITGKEILLKNMEIDV